MRCLTALFTFALVAWSLPASSQTSCPAGLPSNLPDNRLYLVHSDGAALADLRGHKARSFKRPDRATFVYAIHSRDDRPAGMILGKISDFLGGNILEVPESVSVDRNETPFLFLGLFRLQRPAQSSSVSTREYQLFHGSQVTRGLGNLSQFHGSYESAGTNRSTYSDRHRRQAFLFDGVRLNPKDTRSPLGEIVAGTPLAVFLSQEVMAVPKGDGVRQLDAKLRYHGPLQGGAVHLICFSYRPSPDAAYSVIDVFDLDGPYDDGAQGRSAGRKVSARIEWKG